MSPIGLASRTIHLFQEICCCIGLSLEHVETGVMGVHIEIRIRECMEERA